MFTLRAILDLISVHIISICWPTSYLLKRRRSTASKSSKYGVDLMLVAVAFIDLLVLRRWLNCPRSIGTGAS